MTGKKKTGHELKKRRSYTIESLLTPEESELAIKWLKQIKEYNEITKAETEHEKAYKLLSRIINVKIKEPGLNALWEDKTKRYLVRTVYYIIMLRYIIPNVKTNLVIAFKKEEDQWTDHVALTATLDGDEYMIDLNPWQKFISKNKEKWHETYFKATESYAYHRIRSQVYFKEGKRSEETKQINQCFRIIKTEKKRLPKEAKEAYKLELSKLYNHKGSALYELGKLEEAEECFTQAFIKWDPSNVEAWYNRGLVNLKLEKYDEALDDFNTVKRLDSEHIDTRCQVGKIYYMMGELDLALRSYSETLEINPEHAEALYNKGVIYEERGQLEKALECFKRLTELNKRNERAWYRKGEVLRKLGKLNEALKCFSKAPGIGLEDANRWCTRGDMHRELGMFKPAIKYYDEALKIDEWGNESFWNNKGLALLALNRNEKALTCFNEALKIEPENAEIWINKGNALHGIKKEDEALECYKKALEIEPNNVKALHAKGSIFLTTGKYVKAHESFRKALEIESDNAKIWNLSGIVLEKLNQKKKALDCYSEALKREPENDTALYNKGLLLEELGELDDAYDCYRRALELKPRFRMAKDRRQKLMKKMERRDIGVSLDRDLKEDW